MAPLIADVAHVEVPSTPEADAIDPQFRPDRLADVLVDLVGRMVPGPILLIAEEAHWADVASAHLLERIAGATPRAAVGRGRRAARAWRAASSRRRATTIALGPAAPGRDRAPRHRGDRGRAPAPARGPGDRRPGRGQPAVRRGDHPRRPHGRLAAGRCRSPSRPPWPPRSTCSSRPRAASCARRPSSAAASGARCCARRSARDGLTARPRHAHAAVRLPRGRRP